MWGKLLNKKVGAQAQLAGDGTYPWGEKFNSKKLANEKGAKNDMPRKNNKGLRMYNAPKKFISFIIERQVLGTLLGFERPTVYDSAPLSKIGQLERCYFCLQKITQKMSLFSF